MSDIIWSKALLALSLNTRLDQGKFEGSANDFIMEGDITDDILEEWKQFYNLNSKNPIVVENRYIDVYRAIVAKF